ncbi:MAG TPA: hypothetical protein DHS57_05845 [Erysipelotrichaceae bacterium]|nr:hypothetical protein [Erysipelotrichaceae bacterium]
MRKKRLLIIVSCIILIVLFLFVLKTCNKTKISDGIDIEKIMHVDTKEEKLLTQMKEDEERLHNLYSTSDICDENWVKEYREIGKTFQNYKYEGNNEEIKKLLEDYKEYGKKIEEISIIINKQNYDEAIKELEDLKEIANKNEKELNSLYENN